MVELPTPNYRGEQLLGKQCQWYWHQWCKENPAISLGNALSDCLNNLGVPCL